jgi:hypothetical protein
VRTALVACLTLTCTCHPAASQEAPVEHLEALTKSAVENNTTENREAFLEASEANEDTEHITLTQARLDARSFGDKALLFRVGDALFSHAFHPSEGFGDGFESRIRRVHRGEKGGLDTFSCAGCHAVGGPDGAGTYAENAFLLGDGESMSTTVPRNAPAVLGAGLIQALGAEMTSELQETRDAAIREALESKAPARRALISKGISFGSIGALPNGEVDTLQIIGVSPDLVVRPFGWKGNVARLRRFVEDALRIHFGMQSHVLCEEHKKKPNPKLGKGPWFDPDEDGIQREIEEGTLTAGAVYLALLETPVIRPPHSAELKSRWEDGSRAFDEIGCSACHRRSLFLEVPVWREKADSTDRVVAIQLLEDGELPRGTRDVALFSDLKRHDMGKELADSKDDPDGIPRSVFLTRPLWGLAETPPYLHDGRAPTIADAIIAHGGEALSARDKYVALPEARKRSLDIFLLSLSRAARPRILR